jgi:hypothetical protein
MNSEEEAHNASRCPHERDWYCELLEKPCHPGTQGCALGGQSLIDALLAFEIKDEPVSSDQA